MSARLHRLLAVVRADVLIRLRRPSTAVIFVLLSSLPYLWIPSPSTGRALMQIDGRRALYNSAAIGTATAVLATVFIGLAGFYVISNALRRDVLTRCGFVIASTTMRGSEYIAGKFAGNVAFLSIFAFGFMLTAMAMVLVRGEAPLEPPVFAWQYLLLLPPAIFFVSAVAIVFECTPLLRTKAGDVLYFFLWAGTLGIVATMVDGGSTAAASFDISGLGFLLQQMKLEFHTDAISIGGSAFDASKGLVTFHGLGRGTGWLLPRVAATLWPLSLLAVARLFFHRFDPARVRALPNERTHGSWLGRLNRLSKPLVRFGTTFSTRPSVADAVATVASSPVIAVVMAGFAIAALAVDAKALFELLPFAFAACAVTIADVACREKRAATTSLIFAMPGLRERLVAWKFLSALYVGAAFLGIPLLRAAILRPSSLVALVVGLLFVTAAATVLGTVSANPKTFLVVFLSFWYVVLSDKGVSPALDFAGWSGTATLPVTATYAALAASFLILAHLFHTNELRRKW